MYNKHTENVFIIKQIVKNVTEMIEGFIMFRKQQLPVVEKECNHFGCSMKCQLSRMQNECSRQGTCYSITDSTGSYLNVETF